MIKINIFKGNSFPPIMGNPFLFWKYGFLKNTYLKILKRVEPLKESISCHAVLYKYLKGKISFSGEEIGQNILAIE